MALTDSLISYWKLDEASGTRVDVHGSNDLTDNNTVGSASGKINNGADFESANSEFLSHTSNSDLQTGDIDFTFTAWINIETLVHGIIVSKDDDAANSRDYTLDMGDFQSPRFYIKGGTHLVEWSGDLSTSTWYFIVGWHDATANTVNLQVNNATPESATTSGTAPDVSSAVFMIGAREYSGFEGYFDGIIDEVGFWKRVLTSQERTDLYNSGNGLSYDSFGGGTANPLSFLRLGVG